MFGRSARVVTKTRDNDSVEEYEGQEKTKEAIWSSIHDKRFYLSEESPICKGKLRGKFGYQVNTKAGCQVLSGTYAYEESFNKSTKELLEEIPRVSDTTPARHVNTDLKRCGCNGAGAKPRRKLHRQFQEDISVTTKLEPSQH